MKFEDPHYSKQYIHADIVVFTVEDKRVKILLIQRAKEPYLGGWALPGGGIYNDESLDVGAARELEYKTGLKNIYLEQFHTFGEPKRDPRARTIAVAYLALLDKSKVSLLQKTPKTLDAKWWDIKNLPQLHWDHKQMVQMAIAKLRQNLTKSNIAKELLSKQFTLPEMHSAYEIILDRKLDRRNFRRKLLKIGLIEATGKKEAGERNRPAIYYRFKGGKRREADIL